MNQGSIRKRNGCACNSVDSQTKDNPPAKATMLQKDVSVSVCSWEQVSLHVHTVESHKPYLLKWWGVEVSTRQYHNNCLDMLTPQWSTQYCCPGPLSFISREVYFGLLERFHWKSQNCLDSFLCINHYHYPKFPHSAKEAELEIRWHIRLIDIE